MQPLLTIKTARSSGMFGYAPARSIAIAIVVLIHLVMVLVLVDLSDNLATNPWLRQSLQVSLFKSTPTPKPDLPPPVKRVEPQANPPKKLAVKPPDAPAKSTTSDVAIETAQSETAAAQTSETAAITPNTGSAPKDVISTNTNPNAEPALPIEAAGKASINAPLYERALLPINLPSLVKFVAYQGEIEKGAVLGTSTYKIDATADGYQASLEIRLNWLVRTLAGGDRAWGSRGRLSDEGLRPTQITEKRGDRPEKVSDLDLSPGVQDRVSLIWQFGLLARTFPEKFVSGYEFDQPLRVASRVANSRWRVTQENIVIQGVSTSTLAFTRIDTRDDDFRFDCWLDVNERMLPVRLRITGKGYVLDMIKDAAK